VLLMQVTHAVRGPKLPPATHVFLLEPLWDTAGLSKLLARISRAGTDAVRHPSVLVETVYMKKTVEELSLVWNALHKRVPPTKVFTYDRAKVAFLLQHVRMLTPPMASTASTTAPCELIPVQTLLAQLGNKACASRSHKQRDRSDRSLKAATGVALHSAAASSSAPRLSKKRKRAASGKQLDVVDPAACSSLSSLSFSAEPSGQRSVKLSASALKKEKREQKQKKRERKRARKRKRERAADAAADAVTGAVASPIASSGSKSKSSSSSRAKSKSKSKLKPKAKSKKPLKTKPIKPKQKKLKDETHPSTACTQQKTYAQSNTMKAQHYDAEKPKLDSTSPLLKSLLPPSPSRLLNASSVSVSGDGPKAKRRKRKRVDSLDAAPLHSDLLSAKRSNTVDFVARDKSKSKSKVTTLLAAVNVKLEETAAGSSSASSSASGSAAARSTTTTPRSEAAGKGAPLAAGSSLTRSQSFLSAAAHPSLVSVDGDSLFSSGGDEIASTAQGLLSASPLADLTQLQLASQAAVSLLTGGATMKRSSSPKKSPRKRSRALKREQRRIKREQRKSKAKQTSSHGAIERTGQTHLRCSASDHDLLDPVLHSKKTKDPKKAKKDKLKQKKDLGEKKKIKKSVKKAKSKSEFKSKSKSKGKGKGKGTTATKSKGKGTTVTKSKNKKNPNGSTSSSSSSLSLPPSALPTIPAHVSGSQHPFPFTSLSAATEMHLHRSRTQDADRPAGFSVTQSASAWLDPDAPLNPQAFSGLLPLLALPHSCLGGLRAQRYIPNPCVLRASQDRSSPLSCFDASSLSPAQAQAATTAAARLTVPIHPHSLGMPLLTPTSTIRLSVAVPASALDERSVVYHSTLSDTVASSASHYPSSESLSDD